jgi:hypothetical protein
MLFSRIIVNHFFQIWDTLGLAFYSGRRDETVLKLLPAQKSRLSGKSATRISVETTHKGLGG